MAGGGEGLVAVAGEEIVEREENGIKDGFAGGVEVADESAGNGDDVFRLEGAVPAADDLRKAYNIREDEHSLRGLVAGLYLGLGAGAARIEVHAAGGGEEKGEEESGQTQFDLLGYARAGV